MRQRGWFHRLTTVFRGPALIVAVLLTATAAWSLSSISARKVYTAGQVFTAADYNADVDYWITYINQIIAKFPGSTPNDSTKTTVGAHDSLFSATAGGVVSLKSARAIQNFRADSLSVGSGPIVGFRLVVTAGIRAWVSYAAFDTASFRDSTSFVPASRTKFFPGSIFQAAQLQLDSLLAGPLAAGTKATGIFDITTATNWRLGGVAYTGSMANLNTLRDDSMADALHRHSELSASDGSPNPAVQVDADGIAGIGDATPGGESVGLTIYNNTATSLPTLYVHQDNASASSHLARWINDGAGRPWSIFTSAPSVGSATQLQTWKGAVSIADDGYAIIIPNGIGAEGIGQFGAVWGTSNGSCQDRFRSTSSPNHATLGASGMTCGAYTSAVTGTTGADGQLNIGISSAGGLWIENRLGAAASVYYEINVF